MFSTLEKSKKTPQVYKLLSMASLSVLLISVIVSTVECPFLKPNHLKLTEDFLLLNIANKLSAYKFFKYLCKRS